MLPLQIRGNKPNLLDCSTCPSEEMIGNCGSDFKNLAIRYGFQLSPPLTFKYVSAQAVEQGMGDTYAVQTRQVYCQRQLSDDFHKFAEICLERNPDDRPAVSLLLNDHFFKQCKHTSLQEQFLNTMEQVDLDKISGE